MRVTYVPGGYPGGTREVPGDPPGVPPGGPPWGTLGVPSGGLSWAQGPRGYPKLPRDTLGVPALYTTGYLGGTSALYMNS